MDAVDSIISEVGQNQSAHQSIVIMLQKLATSFVACKSEAIRVFRLAEQVRLRAEELATEVLNNTK